MIAALDSQLKLQNWLSPAFPTGGFSYSHGLEWAVETGWVVDSESLFLWLEDILISGSGRQDAIIIAETVRVASDSYQLDALNALAIALAPSSERKLETVQQGNSFQRALKDGWNDEEDIESLSEIAYPVAFGLAVARHHIPVADALPAYLNAFLSNLISAAIRLSVIGQRDGQRLLAKLVPTIILLARSATIGSIDDVGSATLGVDFASLRHEEQYSRLFRS